MSQTIITFSVRESDSENQEMVAELKKHCAELGQSFSWVVLTALKQYNEELKNGGR